MAPVSPKNRGILALSLTLLLSGFSSLGYELAWIRILSLGLGHEYLASLAVVAAFFFGLALGAYATDRLVSSSKSPALWYAGFEIIIGVWALLLSNLLPSFSDWLPQLLGIDVSSLRHWSIAFVVPMVTLLPATMAMGGTLTALDRVYIRRHHTDWSVGKVYGLNTLGAALGIVVSVFILVPTFGYATSLRLLSVLNFVCAALMLITRPSFSAMKAAESATRKRTSDTRRLFVTLFVTGLLGIGFEVLAVRALSQAMEGTVYTMSSVLAVYLVGNAIGAGLYQRFGARMTRDRQSSTLMILMSTAVLIGTFGLSRSIDLHRSLSTLTAFAAWGWFLADLGLATIVLIIPTVVMGALFTHLAQSARHASGGLGTAVGVNTLGGAVAPILIGSAALPVLGVKTSLLCIAALYLLTTIAPILKQRHRLVLLPTTLAVLLIWIGDVTLVSLPDGARILASEAGVMANVTVFEDSSNEVHLSVNNHYQMGGTASYFTDRRQAHIPLLLHPHPQSALFLGVGTGTTIAAAGDHEGLRAVGVELIPELIPLMRHFKKSTGELAGAPWLSIRVADARRFVVSDRATYDVIIADLFHPARDGAANLYTKEHFAKVKRRLSKGGIFCQWLPLYQLDTVTLATIIRTYLSVFGGGRMFMAHFGVETPMLAMISRGSVQRYDADWFHRRVDAALLEKMKAVRLTTPYALFGTYVAGPAALRAALGPGPINTDDHPQVLFSAPRAIGHLQPDPGQRLVSLLDRFDPAPAELIDTDGTGGRGLEASRLQAYWRARNHFIVSGTRMPATRDPRRLLEVASGPLLEAVRTSPDFDPAYTPLLGIAARIGRDEPRRAAELLMALQRANPERNEASRLLNRLAVSAMK